MNKEEERLAEDLARTKNWKRWGPYLSERQWGTVREDYSPGGECWDYFSHDHARSRVYRWGEDGLLGVCDREGRLCLALALWNGRDPILKERLFGLTGPEGNHGEDVKELYYYLDSTPTHSYMKALYKYPQAEFPYARLVDENRRLGKDVGEFEIADSGVFDGDRFFDVVAEYAKNGANDLLARFTITNRGPDAAEITVVPQLWFRNTWSWGRTGEGYWAKPRLHWHAHHGGVFVEHGSLGDLKLTPLRQPDEVLFTENENNSEKLWGLKNERPYVKDSFHRYLVNGDKHAVNPEQVGTKAGLVYRLKLAAGASETIELRLSGEDDPPIVDKDVVAVFAARKTEADEFYAEKIAEPDPDKRLVARQAYAGLLWSKQFYYYVVKDWLEGDPANPKPSDTRKSGRNKDWAHVYNRDVISMPDKWEYPWFAAWDLAFHMITFARIDPQFAKEQIILFLREWYMHPNGQIPAYEFAFGDVNPPVHAWAAWRIYKMTGKRGARDRKFLARVFQKLLLNFTWWVNRKDDEGNNLFSGGFLGLDNIGVFDRSKPLPTGGYLEQADGTAWMAFYCATMLSMALELSSEDAAYEDVASKFFEHFVAIVDAMNKLGTAGLWDELDGFYYDQLRVGGNSIPLRVRSAVGLIPLIAVEVLESKIVEKLPGFSRRMKWFLENRKDLDAHITLVNGMRLLAIPSKDRLERVLRYLLDEKEFLAPYGIRSLSRVHHDHPYVFHAGNEEHRVAYDPGESTTGLFGGNSNWRGPIWMPVNYLLIEALERYAHFYGDTLLVECPTGSGKKMRLDEAAAEIGRRLVGIFTKDASGRRACHGDDARYLAWQDLVLFYEYFHGDTGEGLGASHQTGWTALVARMI